MASVELAPQQRAALVATSFVEGLRFAQGSEAERKVLRSAHSQPIGPRVRIGEGAVAQVVYYPARVQATFDGRPIFAEKIEPVVGIQVSRRERRDGTLVDVTDRYPYTPGFGNLPEDILLSLAEGITQRPS